MNGPRISKLPQETTAKAAMGATCFELLNRRWVAILLWSERFVGGRFWLVKVTVLSCAVSILFSGGLDLKNLKTGYYEGYAKKIEHPLLDIGKLYDAGSHEAKMNYRLTVPILLHPLGLSRDVALKVVLPGIAIASVILVIALSALITSQVTNDRVISLFAALFVSCTYMGSFGFILCYDTITMAQVLAVMLPRIHPVARATLVCSASFTDERGFMACGLLLAAEMCFSSASLRATVFNRKSVSIIVGLLAYWVIRFILARYGGLPPSPIKGVGPGNFVRHIPFWHAGFWFALEGAWLWVLLVFLVVRETWNRWRLILLSGVILVMFAASFANGDVLRTSAYALPLAFAALARLTETEHAGVLRVFAFLAFAISLLGGSYNVYLDQITWFEPLPVALLREMATDLYYIFRIRVFGGMP